ncbi:acyltransferase [Paraglaciecola sp.]|uniref:acyltransferase family protein n=1 Tax=Paraglaciecola sp. TaxID=1920173 RepID=UPI00273F2BEB|nr:acyltransferase [Paraglaciecola sp.]MDP5032330.1 acyltransferase [Paraglaciecola sp.]
MQGRIYYLDVLRAAAIMLVFTGHTVLSFGAPAHLAPLQFGGTGVDLFFLLSGWLIGSQLFAEQKKYDNIDVKRFWVRRWMRTMPAYFVVLILTLIQLYMTKDEVPSPLPYFFFIQNYFYPLEYFSVSWSLSVEEQFYLFVAPFIVFIHRFNPRNQTFILIIMLLLPTVFRQLGCFGSLNETHVRWDCCLMGVLLAHTSYHHISLWNNLKKYSFLGLLLGSVTYIMFFYLRWQPLSDDLFDPSKLLLACIFALIVFYAVNNPIIHKPIGYQMVMHISTRSYSLYLLHPEALAFSKRFLSDYHFIVYYVISLVISLLLSEVLYRLIEVPFIKMRSKFRFSTKRSH